jgi:hypothetical protein
LTLHDLQRAQLVAVAFDEAGPGGSLEQMRAIAMCIRNRVRQGWYDGDWLEVIENMQSTAANLARVHVPLDGNNRSLQRLIADIDEIYFSRRDYVREPSGQKMPDLEEAIGNAVYWAFINQPFSPWFKIHVLDDPSHHPQKANMGLLFFYE